MHGLLPPGWDVEVIAAGWNGADIFKCEVAHIVIIGDEKSGIHLFWSAATRGMRQIVARSMFLPKNSFLVCLLCCC